MDADALLQGARYATVLHVEKVPIAGKTNLRIVYRFVNDRNGIAKETMVRPEQAFASIRMGTLVRIHFCLSRVLRVERVG